VLRRLYDWTMREAASPRAMKALAGVSFAESSFFPIPPDVMLIPMVLADRTKAWRIALVCTLASVIGGVAGYAIGYFLFTTIGNWIFDVYHLHEKAVQFQQAYNEYGFWFVLVAGFTPIPYKLFTIASGTAAMSLPLFMLASVLSRGARFFLVAALLYWFGPPIRAFIERYLGILTFAFMALLIGGFIALRWL
jgi:membrane protein YqaA with SNARE-associated domain